MAETEIKSPPSKDTTFEIPGVTSLQVVCAVIERWSGSMDGECLYLNLLVSGLARMFVWWLDVEAIRHCMFIPSC